MLPSPRDTILPNHRVYRPCIANPPLVDTNSHLSTFPSRLRSLDLAEPLAKSAVPLTPPLTPASALSSQCEARTPPLAGVDDSAIEHCPPLASRWTKSEHLIQSGHSGKCNSPGHTLPSPTSPTLTKGSPTYRATESELEERPASRFLFVSGVPKTATPQDLEGAFLGCGDISGILVRFQVQYGAIVLAFFDVRHAVRAHHLINTRTFFNQNRLGSLLLSDEDLRQLIGESNFIDSNRGKLFISTSFAGFEGEMDTTALTKVLSSFGQLRSFLTADTHTKVFHVEYFDARDAKSAFHALDDRIILDVRLQIAHSKPAGTTATHSPPLLSTESVSPTRPHVSGSNLPVCHPPVLITTTPPPDSSLERNTTRPPLHHSISEQDTRKARAMQPRLHTAEDALDMSRTKARQHIRPRRISNVYQFDAVGKVPSPPSTPSRPRSISVSSETASPVAGRLVLPPDLGYLPPPVGCSNAEQVSPPPNEVGHASCVSGGEDAADSDHGATYHEMHASEQFLVGPVAQPLTHMVGWVGALGMSMHQSHGQLGLENAIDMSLQRNRVDIARIEKGEDTRTTVMIKNIPNKMTDRNLIDFINDVCTRSIDFLYLRMDFMNGCNVGYAFVNFIQIKDLLHFAKMKVGTRWNMFSSEKVLGMSYANYQGKEALIAKFRSSATMAQRESWRPKLFHSSGPQKGLPEDFPARNRLHSKEPSELLANGPHEFPVRR